MSVSVIDGNFGRYDGSVQNPSVRYGRNAASNMEEYTNAQSLNAYKSAQNIRYTPNFADDEAFIQAIEGFADKLEKEDSFERLNYEYKYTKANQGHIDKISLLAAAYEEMGGAKTPVQAMNDKLNRAHKTDIFNTQVLDTNENGLVEIDEYGAFLALADIKSKDKNSTDPHDMTGTITSEGTKEALSYLAVNHKNKTVQAQLINYARNTFKNLQDNLGLTKALSEHNQTSGHIDLLA